MKDDYSEFMGLIRTADRSACLDWAMKKLEGGMDVLSLYRGILAPSLREKDCLGDGDQCIFIEHLRSSIIRTIVENAYPFVVARGSSGRGKKVLVTAPVDEYHDLAVRMAADLFTMAGFEVMVLGANTPAGVIVAAAESFRPDMISLSISNYYHIPTAAREIADMRRRLGEKVLIVVGGTAFENNPGAGKGIGADRVLLSFEDIEGLAKEG